MVSLGLPLFFYLFFVDLLRRVVMSSMVNFFVSFHDGGLDDKA